MFAEAAGRGWNTIFKVGLQAQALFTSCQELRTLYPSLRGLQTLLGLSHLQNLSRSPHLHTFLRPSSLPGPSTSPLIPDPSMTLPHLRTLHPLATPHPHPHRRASFSPLTFPGPLGHHHLLSLHPRA